MAAKLFTPQMIRRGLEIFLLISLAGFAFTFIYGKNPQAVLDKVLHLHWAWLLLGVVLASMDWIGGGLRLWAVARVVHPNPPIGGMMLAGGMSAWAAYLTPLQSGAAPMMIYTMRRFGIPVPVALTSTLMTFIATILFFGIAGPLAIFFGGGRSLITKDAVLGLSLYDLYLGTLSVFMVLGVVLIAVIIFPKHMSALVHKLADWAGRRSKRIAARLEDCGPASTRPTSRCWHSTPRVAGWRCSGPRSLRPVARQQAPGGLRRHAHARHPRELRGHPAAADADHLPALFRPTPGASGIAEVLSALIMAAYVPKELTPALHPHLAADPQLFHHRLRLLRVHHVGAEGLKGISTEGEEGLEAA
jgi:uncharacterized membrane protein YbhN (UPF0104 family)